MMTGGTGLIEWIATVVLLGMLVWITLTDLKHFRIPDAASLPLVLLGLALSTLPTGIGIAGSVTGAGGGYLVFAGLGALFYRWTGQDGLGLGDAKLLAAAGAWLGWRDLPTLVAGAAAGALVFALLTRRHRLAFGPWLAGAFWVLWLREVAG